MNSIQPQTAGIIIAFAARAASAPPRGHFCARLSPHDRIEVTRKQDLARQAGYDRMVIHDRDAGDAAEVGNFLSVYRSGEVWSRYGFARKGDSVTAWCSLTGADIGAFDTLADALQTVLHLNDVSDPVAANQSDRANSIVTDLMPHLHAYRRRLGSAA